MKIQTASGTERSREYFQFQTTIASNRTNAKRGCVKTRPLSAEEHGGNLYLTLEIAHEKFDIRN
jgi:hypothetical protein